MEIGGIIIGDELLAGEVTDVNGPALIAAVRKAGVRLRRLAIVGDEPEYIAAEARLASEQCDLVVSAGGVGPTHDDRTVAAIAAAFGQPVVRHPELEALIRQAMGAGTNAAGLKMAEVPEGATLLAHHPYPIVCFRNIYLLPGVPVFFRAQLTEVARLFEGDPDHTEQLVLRCRESEVAHLLAEVHHRHAPVRIGSYPQFQGSACEKVVVTLRGRDAQQVRAALSRLQQVLPTRLLVETAPDR